MSEQQKMKLKASSGKRYNNYIHQYFKHNVNSAQSKTNEIWRLVHKQIDKYPNLEIDIRLQINGKMTTNTTKNCLILIIPEISSFHIKLGETMINNSFY